MTLGFGRPYCGSGPRKGGMDPNLNKKFYKGFMVSVSKLHIERERRILPLFLFFPFEVKMGVL